jgi:hypothetical protein
MQLMRLFFQMLHKQQEIVMDRDRRNFAVQVAAIAALSAAGAGSASAGEHDHMHGMAGMGGATGEGWKLASDQQSRCGTCRFWGGMRKISDDRKKVVAVSLGWCNNPDSPNYRDLTAPDHVMSQANVWRKWEAL